MYVSRLCAKRPSQLKAFMVCAHSSVYTQSITFSPGLPVGIFGRFLLCFAFTLNLSKLMDTRQKDTSIRSMNGIRFISMTWVILGHTLFFIIVYGITSKLKAVDTVGNY